MEKAGRGEYGEDSDIIGKVFGAVMNAKFESIAAPFICGYLGKQGSDGLHDGYLICPAYGADFRCTSAYMKKV